MVYCDVVDVHVAETAPNFGRGASSLSSLLSMIVGLMISYRYARNA